MRKQLVNIFAEVKIRLDRGNTILAWLRNIVLIVAGVKILFSSFPIWMYIVTAVTLLILFFIIGSVDLDYFRIFQKEQELNTKKYNPHLGKIQYGKQR